MKPLLMKRGITIVLMGTAALLAVSIWTVRAHTQTLSVGPTGSPFAVYQATSLPASQLINPEDLVKLLKSQKPLIIQVGSRVLYQEAHIPGSEYLGPASNESGLQSLRNRVESLPRSKFIILYCGCCPWSHCPNVKPANDALHALGFTHVKVLYIANNFGTDWVDRGYPVAKGD
ncbi:MAG: rhodanese-like domain-containing protein [Terriglobales bacterium]